MSAHDVRATDVLEALRQPNARNFRFLYTKGVESRRNVFQGSHPLVFGDGPQMSGGFSGPENRSRAG